MMPFFKTDKRLFMAEGLKLLHIVSDNNLIKVVQRFVLSLFRTLRRRKCTGFSKFFSYSENGSSADPSCLNSMLNIMMSCPALSVSRNSLRH